MVGRHFGKQRPQDGPDQLHQPEDDARVLGDLEQAEEEGQHAHQAEGDLRCGLREVERGTGDRVELHEAHRLEHDARRGGLGRGGRSPKVRQDPLQLLVARARDFGDRRERLGQGRALLEAELHPFLGLQQVAGIAASPGCRPRRRSRRTGPSRSGSRPERGGRPGRTPRGTRAPRAAASRCGSGPSSDPGCRSRARRGSWRRSDPPRCSSAWSGQVVVEG